MNRPRLLKWCLVTIGLLLLVEFAVVLQFQLSFYGVAALVVSIGCFVVSLLGDGRVEQAARSRAFVYSFALFTGGIVVWVVAQVFSLYVLN